MIFANFAVNQVGSTNGFMAPLAHNIQNVYFPNGSDYKMITCYLGLYEEGEVEYINGVWSSFLDLQLVSRKIQRI